MTHATDHAKPIAAGRLFLAMLVCLLGAAPVVLALPDEPAGEAAAEESATAEPREGAERPVRMRVKSGGGRITIAQGETHRGDLYRGGSVIDIAGTQDGDLYAWAQEVIISGTVTGDLNTAAQSLLISGSVRDSVRAAGNVINVTGLIDGDLIGCAGTVTVAEGAHITGDVMAFGGLLRMNGTVDGDLKAYAGQVELGGTVGGDGRIECDVLKFEQGARIGGDLDYEARRRLDPAPEDQVGGTISYKIREPKEKGSSWLSFGKILKTFLLLGASLLAGLALLAIFRRAGPVIVGTVSGDPLRSAGIGFVTFIVVPIAALISCILIITIPLALIAFLLYLVALWLAKLPVAVWLGGRLLRLAGRPDPSPYPALVIGLLLLYVIFLIPFLGSLTYLACIFVGLGAIVMGAREHFRNGRASVPGGPPGAPPPHPGSGHAGAGPPTPPPATPPPSLPTT